MGSRRAPDDPIAAALFAADAARAAGELGAVLGHLENAVALAESGEQNAARMAYLLRRLADTRSDLGRCDEAALRYRAIFDIYGGNGFPERDVADAVRGAARNAERQGKRTIARYLWRNARYRYAQLECGSGGRHPGVGEAEASLAALGDSDEGDE